MTAQNSFEISVANKEGRKGRFEELLMEAVESVFSSLGKPCKQGIYLYLESRYNISRREIPRRIEDFANALEEIFGIGAKLIEIEIMRLLFRRVRAFKYSPKNEGLLFVNYVRRLGDF